MSKQTSDFYLCINNHSYTTNKRHSSASEFLRRLSLKLNLLTIADAFIFMKFRTKRSVSSFRRKVETSNFSSRLLKIRISVKFVELCKIQENERIVSLETRPFTHSIKLYVKGSGRFQECRAVCLEVKKANGHLQSQLLRWVDPSLLPYIQQQRIQRSQQRNS